METQIPCITCGRTIPWERFAILPYTLHCVNCSPEEHVRGRLVYSHKTAPELNVVTKQEFQNLQRLDRRGKKQ